MRRADLQPGEAIERALEDQMREEHGRLQRIPDGVAQSALSLQSRVLRRARRRLRVHEQQHAELLRLGPERIELAIGQLLTFDAAADRRAAQSQLPDGLVQLLGRKIGMLQRERRHPDEAIRMLRAPLRDLLVLQRDDDHGPARDPPSIPRR